MKIELLYFAHAARLAGVERESAELEATMCVEDLKQWILERHPELRGIASTLLFAVDEELSRPETVLRPNQTVAVMPPFSGG